MGLSPYGSETIDPPSTCSVDQVLAEAITVSGANADSAKASADAAAASAGQAAQSAQDAEAAVGRFSGDFGSTLIVHKRASVAGVTTYARSIAELKELQADDSDGLSLIHFIPPSVDGALLAGDHSEDLSAYIDNALAELRAVQISTGRNLALNVPPLIFRHNPGQMQLDIPNLTMRSNGGKFISSKTDTNPLFLVTAPGFNGIGIRSLLDAAVTTAHHWRFAGAHRSQIFDCHWDYSFEQNTPSAYNRQSDDLTISHCSARGANAVFGFSEGNRVRWIAFKAIAATGGDDVISLKAFNQTSNGCQIIGCYMEGFAAMLSIGSNVGKPGADDPSREYTVAGTIFNDNRGEKCASMLKNRPGGGSTDYRYGYAEVSMNNNTLVDLFGEKMGSPIELIPGRNGKVKVTGSGNKVIGRFASSQQWLITAAYGTVDPGHVDECSPGIEFEDPWSGAANGAVITPVGSLGPDPKHGLDVGETVPGYPLENALNINPSSLTIANKAFQIDIAVDGTSLNGLLIAAGLDGKVAITERFHAKNVNGTSNPNAAAIRALSVFEILTDNISIERTSKVHANLNNPYRLEGAGGINTNRVIEVPFGDVAAGTDKKRSVAWANRGGLYLAKVTGVNGAAVAADAANYARLGIYDPDNSNSLVGSVNTAATALVADAVFTILDAKSVSAANHHKLQFDTNERIQLEKKFFGTGAALTDFRAQLHVAPF